MKAFPAVREGHDPAARAAAAAHRRSRRDRLGLDIDALKVVAEGVNRVRATGDVGIMLITHYTRILRYIRPDFVHVFVDGRIVQEGGPELADQLEAKAHECFAKLSGATT